MSLQLCPVCGEEIPPGPACPACDAVLGGELPSAPSTEPTLDGAPAPPETGRRPEAAGDSEATNELLGAFRRQFEQSRIELPAAWVERIRRLATEVEASRRLATVFFVDLRGYTRLSSVLSDQQLDQLRQWFFGVCTRRVELHGGFLIQFIGDAVFAAFGAPWAFERDSESALRALLEIREEVRRRGQFEGQPLAIRAGADLGPVNVCMNEIHGVRRLDLFGETVNLAARLEAAGDTWDLLISDTLAGQVGGVFHLEPRPPFQPKNYRREVTPYAVLGHKEEAAVRRRQDLALVGRRDELARIAGWMENVAGGGFVAGRILGPAGIGKTRLIQEAITRHAGGRLHAATINCEPHARHTLLFAALSLLHQLATWAADRPPGTPLAPEAQLEALRLRLGGLDPLLLPSLGYILGVPEAIERLRSLPAEQLRRQVLSALEAVVAEACRSGPWVAFIDDVQWCDRLSHDLLNRLIERRPGGLLLLLAGRRPEESADQDAWNFEDHAAANPAPALLASSEIEELTLAPLASPDARALLGQIVDLDLLHPRVRNRLLHETEGLPLYMIELASEAASAPGATPAPAEDGPELPGETVPLSLIDVLQTRIDRLTTRRRALLQYGAVIGRHFSVKMIDLLGRLQEDLIAELYALKSCRMLRELPQADDLYFAFTPTILREVAYRMLTGEQKTELHRNLAEQIERKFPDRLKQFALELAFHWLRGGDLEKTRRHLREAVRKALEYGSPQEAETLLRWVLKEPGVEPSTGGGPDRAADQLARQQEGMLYELGGKVCRMLGDLARSNRYYEEYARIACEVGNTAWQANAAHQLALNAIEQGAPARGEALLREASGWAGSSAKLAAALRLCGGLLKLRTGRLDEAEADYREAAALAGADGQPPHYAGDAGNNLGLVYWLQGDLSRAAQAFEQALEVWRRTGNVFGQVATLSNLGIIAEKLGRFQEALAIYTQALGLAEQIGYLHGIGAIESNRANLSLLGQDWPAAQAQAARSLHFARLIGHNHSISIALENLGLALGGLGLADEALAKLEEAAALGARIQDPGRRDSARLAHAWVLLSREREQEAAALLDAMPEVGPELASWRQLLGLACRSLQAGEAAMLLEAYPPEKLAELKRDATTEDAVRCLDALALVAGRLGLGEKQEEFLARRRATLQECAG